MKAPAFSLLNPVSNERISLEDYKGKPLLLTFWASWCPDSQIDLDKKAKIQQSLEEAGLHLLFINVEGRERNRGDGKQFMDNAPYTVLYVIDDGMTTYEAYRAIGVPTTVLINERGEVSERFGDKTPFTEIVQHLTPWIR